MSEALSLAIVGAHGRMGQRLVALAGEDDRLTVAARVDADTPPLAALVPATISCVIDFSVRQQIGATASWCGEHGVPLVMGTTGLEPSDHGTLDAAAARAPVVWAPNFSVGVNALLSLVGKAAELLGEAFDLEVVEAHHRRKVDAPSGTARALGEALAAARGLDYDDAVRCGREGIVGARTDAEIGMSVVRGGDVVGEHTVLYLGAGEQVSIAHRATNRDIFVLGALRAARWVGVEGRAAGRYTMGDVLAG